jgi:hypothetical protein
MPIARRSDTEDEIRIRAYHLWEADGRPFGRDTEFWEKAIAAIGRGRKPATRRKAAKA